MTGPSLFVTGTALAFVLGLLVVLAALLRRFVPRGGGSRLDGVEVLSRVTLAPRQGVATISVEGRTALVSYGEGGIRFLMDLTEAQPVAEETEAPPEEGSTGDEAGFRSALARAARKVPALKALALCLAVAATMPAEGAAASPVLAVAPSTSALVQDVQSSTGPGETPRNAPDVRVSVGAEGEGGLELSGPVGTVLFVGFLTVLPTLLLLMTSFTRILIVLHLLKQALGTQTAPPAHLLAAMALMLTGFVMAPTLEEANDRAVAPWMAGELDSAGMLQEASIPFRAFMLRSTREQDLAQFVDMSSGPVPETVDDIGMTTLTAAFVTSELTSAFQMGFALFLPFVVIDVVVASVLMSMGMFMLPPVMVSLPFKLLLFVLVDGWSLVLGSLVQSF